MSLTLNTSGKVLRQDYKGDKMNDEIQAYYSGFEPVEVENLDDVKETRTVIPATKNVVMKITKAENLINKENTYRQISLQLRITKGIDENGKYKGKVVFGRVCYYADPNVYNKDFFKHKQHLVQLKYLLRSTGIEGNTVDGHTLDKLMQAPEIKADITIKKRTIMVDDGTGTQIPEEQLDNEVRNYKFIPATDLV